MPRSVVLLASCHSIASSLRICLSPATRLPYSVLPIRDVTTSAVRPNYGMPFHLDVLIYSNEERLRSANVEETAQPTSGTTSPTLNRKPSPRRPELRSAAWSLESCGLCQNRQFLGEPGKQFGCCLADDKGVL